MIRLANRWLWVIMGIIITRINGLYYILQYISKLSYDYVCTYNLENKQSLKKYRDHSVDKRIFTNTSKLLRKTSSIVQTNMYTYLKYYLFFIPIIGYNHLSCDCH